MGLGEVHRGIPVSGSLSIQELWDTDAEGKSHEQERCPGCLHRAWVRVPAHRAWGSRVGQRSEQQKHRQKQRLPTGKDLEELPSAGPQHLREPSRACLRHPPPAGATTPSAVTATRPSRSRVSHSPRGGFHFRHRDSTFLSG